MNDASVRCRLCGERFRLITPTHLRSRHRWSGENLGLVYKERYRVDSLWSGASRRAMSESLLASHDRRGRLWTRARLLAAMGRLKTSRFRDVMRRAPKLYWAAQRLFGTWKAACRAARIPEPAPQWTRERVREEIRGRSDVRWSRVPGSLYGAAQRLFGAWRVAVRAAGAILPEPRWTRETALLGLRRRARAGRPLSSSAVRRDDLPLCKAVFRLFGRWSAAISKV